MSTLLFYKINLQMSQEDKDTAAMQAIVGHGLKITGALISLNFQLASLAFLSRFSVPGISTTRKLAESSNM